MNYKKAFFCLISVITICVLCSFSYSTGNSIIDIREVPINGHTYVVASTSSPNTFRPGGVSIIHSESCRCKH